MVASLPCLALLFLLLGWRFGFSGALSWWLLTILLCQKLIFHADHIIVAIWGIRMISRWCFLKLTIVLYENKSGLTLRILVSWWQLTVILQKAGGEGWEIQTIAKKEKQILNGEKSETLQGIHNWLELGEVTFRGSFQPKWFCETQAAGDRSSGAAYWSQGREVLRENDRAETMSRSYWHLCSEN